MLKLFLIVVGIVCLFIAGAGGVTSFPRPRWEWIGAGLIACGLLLPLP